MNDLGLDQAARQEELFTQLLMPLLPEVGGGDDENAALAFRPALRKYEARFDGLAESDLVRQQRAFGERRAEGE